MWTPSRWLQSREQPLNVQRSAPSPLRTLRRSQLFLRLPPEQDHAQQWLPSLCSVVMSNVGRSQLYNSHLHF
ncbi:hypothetical protein GBAR_LOCUS30523 [Geodia barretti]|uniref:Uncharacterized protein n=1 Tax=Geodia barretti TaxID=519541 RepID=A0AA35TWZ9_GEOBA|nr:hypothetical protein GBAR_LOCUS30523 [Geodia barretti]